MAFAIKAVPATSESSSSSPTAAVLQWPSTSPSRPAAAAAVKMSVRKNDPVAVVRAFGASAPRPPAPGPPVAKPAGKRVSQTMSRLKEQGKTALIPFITAGDPDLATTAEALRLLDTCGADVIELGVPFSDPCVDGPVIQASMARARVSGTTVDGVLAMLKEVTPELSCPVVIFSYFNTIVRRGLPDFAAAVKTTGGHGLIVPDLPYSATCALRTEAMANNLELVLLTTPATPEERMKEITKSSEGFVYLVSVNGVTGSRSNVNTRVESLIQEVKQIAEWGADGVIIGSAMVKQWVKQHLPKKG